MCQLRECWQQVFADRPHMGTNARLDARAADNERYSQAAFGNRTLAAPQRWISPGRAVIGGDDDESIVGDAQFIEFLENHPECDIQV